MTSSFDSVTSRQIQAIKNFIYSAYTSAKEANNILFRDINNKCDELIAAAYINQAISFVLSCKALYYSNLKELENTNIEDIFSTFDIFSNEFLTNLSSSHSHQWTDIEFNSFKDSIEEAFGSIDNLLS